MIEESVWRELAVSLYDDEPCWYDHHGYCQTHLLHPRPCLHEQIKELLAKEGR